MLTLIESTTNHEFAIDQESHLVDLIELTPKDYIINYLDCSRQWKATKLPNIRYKFDIVKDRYILTYCGKVIGKLVNAKSCFYYAMYHNAKRGN